MNQKVINLSQKKDIELLRKADTATIQALSKKVKTDIKRLVTNANLSIQDAEELMNDAIVITITAIRSGKFQDMDYHPSVYVMGVVKKLIANRLRKKRLQTNPIEDITAEESSFNPETYLKNKERQLIVEKLLLQLGRNCRKLIKLKYFQYLKDQEIIEEEMTTYTTIGSLKSKRSQCLKKLAALARQAGITKAY